MSMIDSFLSNLRQAISAHDGHRVADFLILNFDGLPPAKQEPYSNLHKELNSRFQAGKDAPLSTKVKATLSAELLKGTHSRFCEAIIQYFRYVRDFPNDSGLAKYRKIDRITTLCSKSLDTNDIGATLIPVVLHLINTLKQISLNLDRDPDLLGASSGGGGEDDVRITYVEQTGNTLRDAFSSIAGKSSPTRPPSSDQIDSGLYRVTNLYLSIYTLIDRISNAAPTLQGLERSSPPLEHYPASQRVIFLYYLGIFYFNCSHFYRALQCLQEAYDQVPKTTECLKQRQKILIHLMATSICMGRLPGQILLRDQAAHSISLPFLILSKWIKWGHIGAFHTFTDSTLPPVLSQSAQWLLKKRVLLHIRNRCELLCWRSLIYRAMKYTGFHGSNEEGRQSSMPWVRFEAIHQAACFSYEAARQSAYEQTNSEINLYPDEEGNEGYIDPDFADSPTNYSDGSLDVSIPETDKSADHPTLHDPTPQEINSIILSLISQGLLKGFITYDANNNILQSRFAIPGIRAKSKSDGQAEGDVTELWKSVGFPPPFQVIRGRENEVDEGDVPGWVTAEKVRRTQQANANTGGGNVVRLSGARMKTFGS